MRILSKTHPADYSMFLISAQLTSFTHPKHAILGYLYWRNNLYICKTQFGIWIQRFQHSFVQPYSSFHLQQNYTWLPWKKIINTLVLIRGHTALVFSALFRSFIGTPSFYSLFNMILILPLDLNKKKIHSQPLHFM